MHSDKQDKCTRLMIQRRKPPTRPNSFPFFFLETDSVVAEKLS